MSDRLNQLAINSDGFIFDPVTGDTFTVNATGISIIEGLKQGKSREELVVQLKELYMDATQDIERDIIDFTEQLKKFRVL